MRAIVVLGQKNAFTTCVVVYLPLPPLQIFNLIIIILINLIIKWVFDTPSLASIWRGNRGREDRTWGAYSTILSLRTNVVFGAYAAPPSPSPSPPPPDWLHSLLSGKGKRCPYPLMLHKWVGYSAGDYIATTEFRILSLSNSQVLQRHWHWSSPFTIKRCTHSHASTLKDGPGDCTFHHTPLFLKKYLCVIIF